MQKVIKKGSIIFFIFSEKHKLDEFCDKVKEHAFEKKHDIIISSHDPEDAITKMEDEVDEAAIAFVERDDFLKSLPEQKIQKIKDELCEPFRRAYVTDYITLFIILFFQSNQELYFGKIETHRSE